MQNDKILFYSWIVVLLNQVAKAPDGNGGVYAGISLKFTITENFQLENYLNIYSCHGKHNYLFSSL